MDIFSTPVHGYKAKLKRPSWTLSRCNRNFKFFSLALLWCKLNILIFELNLIAVLIEHSNYRLGLITVQISFSNFRGWPYWGTNWLSKFSSLALLRCKMTFEILELALIAVQNEFQNYRALPYCGANRLGLIAVHQRNYDIFTLIFLCSQP